MAKNGFVSAMDGLSKLVKIILCLPFLNIIWAIYRIVKGATEGQMIILVAGILWIFPGSCICWIIDLVTTILNGKPTILA